MAETIAYGGLLVVEKCWCGIRHAIPSELADLARRKRDAGEQAMTIYCPLGHGWVYSGPSIREELEAAKAKQRHLQDQLEAAEADAEATRVKLIRDRHRFANGVCPCCNRSFENVARHMRTQHPDFDPADLGQPATMYKCSCGRSFASPHGLKIHQARQRGAGWTDPKISKYWRHLTVTK